MNIQEIIAELKRETVRLDQAIAALEGMDSRPRATKGRTNIKISTSTNKNSQLSSAELSAKRSEAMKKSWAARRKNA